MWKLIFDSTTLRGTGFNREPVEGEFEVYLPSYECAWFYHEPSRYQFVDGALSEVVREILDAEKIDGDKARIWEAIKTERDRRQDGGFKVGEKWFHSDPTSRLQHLGLKDEARDILANGGTMESPLLIAGQAVAWKTMDGTFEPLTVQTAFDIVAAGKILDAMLFARAEQHRAAVEASQDPATYDFSTGWPEAYGL